MANTKLPSRLLDTSAVPALNVTGDLDVGGADGNNAVMKLSANTGNWVFTNVQASRNLEISDSDGTGTVLTIDTSGKVGIGAAAPSAKLEVRGANGAYSGGILLSAGSSVSEASALYHDNSSYTTTVLANRYGHANAAIKLKLQDASGSPVTALTALGSGNVGIGTTSPDSPLEISSADDTRLKITDTGDSSELVFRSDGVNTQIYTNTAHDLGIYTSSNVGQIHLKQSNGHVGIGTANPAKPLHISSSDNQPLRVESTDAYTGIELKDNGSATLPPLISALSDDFIFYGGHASSRPTIMFMDSSSGSVTVGNESVVTRSQAGFQIKKAGLLINGTSSSSSGIADVTHHSNYWTFFGSGGTSGSRSGNFRVSVPSPTGTPGNAWGGFQLEIYISGYNGKYCHAMLSGYTNGGVTLSESTIIRSSGSHSVSYGAYHTGGSSNQGFYFDIDIPAYTHPSAFYRITKAGDVSGDHQTDLKSVVAAWS